MSRDLSKLTPEFKAKAENLLSSCKVEGHQLVPFYTIRSVYEQARLWRQSRSIGEIKELISKLHREGADFLSEVLESVGPQYGRWATNALPGQSWHQWGEAIDCFVLGENGRAIWSTKHPGYELYAEEAKKLGLTAGYFWFRKDAVHVQFRSEPVRSVYTWPEIDAKMKLMFGKGE